MHWDNRTNIPVNPFPLDNAIVIDIPLSNNPEGEEVQTLSLNTPQHQTHTINDPIPPNPITPNTTTHERRGKKTKDVPSNLTAGPSPAEITFIKEELLMKVDTDEFEHIKKVINIHDCLKQAEAIFPNFNVMLLGVRRNKLIDCYYDIFFSSVKIDSKTKLIDLTEEQAELLGRSFASSLQGNTLSDTAVAEWVTINEQLKELEIVCPWFRQLMNEIARELLSTSSWGLIFRVGSSVAIGWADLGTDGVTIYDYFDKGQAEEGWTLLAMVG